MEVSLAGAGAGAGRRTDARAGGRISVAEGASLRQVVVERSDGGVPVSPAAYTVTVYSAPAEEGRTFGVDSQGRVYQDNRRYSASPEQAEELTALLERICS